MRNRHLRAALALAAAAALVGVPGAFSVANAATAGCRVTYAVGSQWPGGFTANVSLTNLGDALNGWTLTWSFPAGQQVTQAWNASVTQSGAQARAVNAAWNGALATNGSTAFGFNGTSTGSNPAPTDFALNGVVCTGATTPTTGPTATPSTSAPPTSGTTPPTGTVRVYWLKPTDVAYDQRYPDGIANVMREAQRYYRQDLGRTFKLNDPVVEVVNGDHPRAWYETTPNGNDCYWWVVFNMQQELMRKLNLRAPDSRWVTSTTQKDGILNGPYRSFFS